MNYLPFGEPLVDEHNNSHNTPFKFNGKEFDEETGNYYYYYYYYSARYYDPKMSIFISVDPLVEETFDTYGYTYNNPINLVDPTGMNAEDPQPPTDIFMVFKNHDGTYRAQLWKRIKDGKNEQMYMIMDEGGKYATEIFQGKEAGLDMHKAGIKLDDINYGYNTLDVVENAAVDFWTSDEYRTKSARETAVSYVTSLIPFEGMVVGMLAQTGKLARGLSVIGPRANYREFAKKIGANFLDVTDDAWTMRKNIEFLQGVVKRGDDVIFSGKYNPARLDPSSVLAQEIRYLQRHGYSWDKNFTKLVKQ
ncbi:RHS repeat domain-containing protein [Flavobacterium litorale]|uniref:RHS repeat-associated core domain-containing protein n=1 Tax=Flavobacterium litorale TaxID=2856519 RepID=A0ABX8V5Y0_9FLAO|nr:RHS repeat-associated core domain-containing protein [Flavobacterium litorale]QYJ68235.1 hypothetical protein K1I41_12015 [Flavobacterium litorale]